LQKNKDGEKIENYPIFMAVGEKCGHDRRGKPISEDDLPEIAKEYKKFKERNKINF
jgi:type I restriction enzyme M protein